MDICQTRGGGEVGGVKGYNNYTVNETRNTKHDRSVERSHSVKPSAPYTQLSSIQGGSGQNFTTKQPMSVNKTQRGRQNKDRNDT